MSALKEALRSAIEDWNTQVTLNTTQVTQPEPAPTPTQTKQPKAKILFDYIKANPGKTLKEITAAMVAQGVGASTADSYVYQMIRAGHIHRDANNTLYSLQPEYEPIRPLAAVATMEYPAKSKFNPKRRKPGPKPKAKAKPTPKPKTTYPVEETKPEPTPTRTIHVQQNPNTVEQDVELILSMLNVRTAHQLRKALNEMFK
jgi:hypothetical protein